VQVRGPLHSVRPNALSGGADMLWSPQLTPSAAEPLRTAQSCTRFWRSHGAWTVWAKPWGGKVAATPLPFRIRPVSVCQGLWGGHGLKCCAATHTSDTTINKTSPSALPLSPFLSRQDLALIRQLIFLPLPPHPLVRSKTSYGHPALSLLSATQTSPTLVIFHSCRTAEPHPPIPHGREALLD